MTSPDIKPGRIADEQVYGGCGGKNISPALSWSDAPKGTKSFALSVYDPDAPTGERVLALGRVRHPAGRDELAEGRRRLPSSDAAPKGAIQSRTDWGVPGYGGPCPPKGDKPHHYHFTIFAVDTDKPGADENSSAAVVGFNLHFHTLAKATLTGVWGH